MNFFNREQKLFTDRLKTTDQKLVVPSGMTKAKISQEGKSQKEQDTKRGTLIFTNRASLFAPQELGIFFEQASSLIRREKKYGRIHTPDAIRAYYEAGRSVIGVSDYQVWGHTCLVSINQEIDVLEATIREDFQGMESAKRMVDLFAHREADPFRGKTDTVDGEKAIFALSWTSYTQRLFRELAWLPCQIEALDKNTQKALKTYDEFAKLYLPSMSKLGAFKVGKSTKPQPRTQR